MAPKTSVKKTEGGTIQHDLKLNGTAAKFHVFDTEHTVASGHAKSITSLVTYLVHFDIFGWYTVYTVELIFPSFLWVTDSRAYTAGSRVCSPDSSVVEPADSRAKSFM
jgi:hypothetical protein